ncbi:predicted protein [Naegleria gruberi]|uniref:Predicted protein n=1 Tax=Naegleria gruberi TaxID=5762 RepID=D2V4A0_NAEGR|nr:uncharacterized protein NAEGRDRAFT_63648 [Naegleria gruberi]EFC48347.1 predicted protein [Naegleria gruberi]|eukprot:XP_002681091.1 predicted protein [Naegleria gruberi strain NEG-M]
MMNNLNRLKVLKTIVGREVSEGAGIKVCRTIGGQSVSYHDPFLLLDEAKIPNPKNGFPEHPHKGFEAISYILNGNSKHKDSLGKSGFLSSGDALWMTAGRGIRHEETPIGNGPLHAFQIWVNLSAKDKLIEPYSQVLKSSENPKKQISEHVHLTLLAGKSISHDLTSSVLLKTPVLVSHVKISKKNEKLTETIPKGFQGLVYLFAGDATIENQQFVEKSAILFEETSEDSLLEIDSTSDQVQFLILSGKPIKEPIARHGPFVMNTKEEIMQAFQDYHSGLF